LDESGQPTEKIEDKETYHLMDAERYILGWLMRTNPPAAGEQVEVADDAYKSERRSRWHS
jgi:hypothetical protein